MEQKISRIGFKIAYDDEQPSSVAEQKTNVIKTFNVLVEIDGEVMCESDFGATAPVVASKFSEVEFDLYTCSCGIAGCAGYFDDIYQTRSDSHVTWKLRGKTSEQFKTETLVFDRNQFDEAFETLRKDIFDLETQGYHFVCVLDSFYDGESESHQREPGVLKDYYEHALKWFREEAFQRSVVKATQPELFEKAFFYSYKDEKSSYEVPFADLVKYFICNWSRDPLGTKKRKAAAEDALQESCNALAHAIQTGDNSKLEALVLRTNRGRNAKVSDVFSMTKYWESKEKVDWTQVRFIEAENTKWG